jgi:hypothetical protein
LTHGLPAHRGNERLLCNRPVFRGVVQAEERLAERGVLDRAIRLQLSAGASRAGVMHVLQAW